MWFDTPPDYGNHIQQVSENVADGLFDLQKAQEEAAQRRRELEAAQAVKDNSTSQGK